MRGKTSSKPTAVRLVGLAGASALALILSAAFPAGIAHAQAPMAAATGNEQMLLEANTLTYDDDGGTVTASGNVQIDYNGTRLVARKVVFNRKTSRLVAQGDVEIIDRQGNKSFADEIDVTDDMRDGFVNALRIETSDKTYFASESGERRAGNITMLNSGVYTACEPCEMRPGRPPIWRIKATRIIWNGQEKTVRFERSRLEIFGFPIAFFPALEVPDHTVKRKTGFLFPGFDMGTGKGFGVKVPYYWALSPTYDLTTSVTGYTSQGFLAEAEWRQRFNNGDYSVRAAGIYQLNPNAFTAGTTDQLATWRGMIGTTGRFQINPRWAFGWNAMVQSDQNFSYRYNIANFNGYYHRDEVYLTGINDRNYFDIRTMRWQIQENTANGTYRPYQPLVLPVLDYSYTFDRPIFGGELNLDINSQNIFRTYPQATSTALIAGTNVPGVGGSNGRFTAELEWKRQIVAPGGLVLTPLLAARGDGIYTGYDAATLTALNSISIGGIPVAADIRSAYFRGMATAGLEARWPILLQTANTSHVFEPMAQVFARPDSPFRSTIGVPNEDAQSMVFDASTLFERDKFSGYDAIEGGVRANVGIRYTGQLWGGWGAQGIFGQSYHLAGQNPFGQPDLVNAGAYSGLESATSDVVGLVGVTSPGSTSFAVGGRFDEKTLEMRRFDARAGTRIGPVSVSGNYAYIQKQALYGYPQDRQQVSLSTAAKVAEYWRVFGSGTYDFQSSTLVSNSIGFTYDDECFTFTFTASQTRAPGATTPTNSFGVQFSLRTIGDFGQSSTNFQ